MANPAIDSHPSDICLACDGTSAVVNGFCLRCAAEIERDIDEQDRAPEPMKGRIHFGIFLPDQYGGSPE